MPTASAGWLQLPLNQLASAFLARATGDSIRASFPTLPAVDGHKTGEGHYGSFPNTIV
jgi:hypothetical protein